MTMLSNALPPKLDQLIKLRLLPGADAGTNHFRYNLTPEDREKMRLNGIDEVELQLFEAWANRNKTKMYRIMMSS